MKRRKLRIGKTLGSNHVPLLSFSIPSNPLAVIGWEVLVTCLRATVPPLPRLFKQVLSALPWRMLLHRISSYTGVCKSHTQVVSVITPALTCCCAACVQQLHVLCTAGGALFSPVSAVSYTTFYKLKTCKRSNLLVLYAV